MSRYRSQIPTFRDDLLEWWNSDHFSAEIWLSIARARAGGRQMMLVHVLPLRIGGGDPLACKYDGWMDKGNAECGNVSASVADAAADWM